ncbi:putative receptor-like protein kinase At3g47110 [Lolium rigidum]|uniref:putative receptor-like protein kinase At3g47110 n=1 Tax=Lolium rigidum TaxID=89674 RepID=UPI001F5DD9AC|nr:putative receptor-like protein kinase At3g47110 [Lolium rigidum]XP_047059216.1 putative receptor-like protein kinase At3g47110 [Lolium rigidum]
MHSHPAMKATTSVGQLLILVLLAYCTHGVACSSLLWNETDRLSLLGFKDAITLDPQQAFMSWNDTTHFCNWEGVTCRAKNTLPRRVTSLNLTSRGLVGHISPSLGNLTFLHSLVLTENTLTGEIPQSLGHLRRLQTLNLSNNTLQGRIPSLANCSKLEVLDVSFNNLVGQFPSDLPPHHLQVLQIAVNNLTGTIPASLANITTLTVISCTLNHFKGNIPSKFADLSGLQYLQASGNRLTGRFPQAVLNISTIIGLNLAYNGLSGEVPPNLCTSLPNLQFLLLDGNFFLGHIPSSFTNASNLNTIDLSGNNFTGLVPTTIGKLTKLSLLNLEDNQLRAHSRAEWEFLDSLSNCTELKIFTMSINRLSGHVPSSLGNLSNQLQELYLAENQLSGDFPSGIANLRNLFTITLGENQFTGVVPDWIGTLTKLQEISLFKNFFTGSIPSSLSNLSRLGMLDLYSNHFTGHMPSSFGNLPMLQGLDISHNNLHGRIPKEIFRIPSLLLIDLSFNNLEGQLPTTIGNAKQLESLVLSANKLYGDIPNTLSDCESLEAIELDSNVFSGSIPTLLGRITSLNVLNLSTNNLSGSIPISLGNLQFLEKLDLSLNHLYGEVPRKGIFKNASAVRIDGNKGLCGGALELHLLACDVFPSNSTRLKEPLVLKVVIPTASIILLAMVLFGIMQWRVKHKSKSISPPSFATKFPQVSFNDLARATQGFSTSNLIGGGGYGSVYKGKLVGNQHEVAIKVFNLETRGAHKSFIAECNALRNVRHRNLVCIVTACSSIDSNGNDFKALVYDLMPRGDLDKLLYPTRDHESTSDLDCITMAQRMSIVVDVADAMEYLHHNNQGTMVHCDLKPSNILLDDNMTAHVGDFGLARFKDDSTTLSLGNPNYSSVALRGTIGYAAPEYAVGGQVSTAADVYSFGVILLEVFIRRRPTDAMFKDGLSIVKFTEINFPDRVLEIVDPQLLQELELCKETPLDLKESGLGYLISMLNVGLCCTKPSPGERINMQQVATKLHGIRDAYLREN